MQAIDVREYAFADREDVVALWRLVFADDPPRNAPERVIERKLGTQRDLFLVAVREEHVVGTVLGGYDGFRGWVYHLAVHPDHRRAGFGRELMRELEIRLRALGCPKLNLQIRAENADVRAFYERLGYCVEDRLSMGKALGELEMVDAGGPATQTRRRGRRPPNCDRTAIGWSSGGGALDMAVAGVVSRRERRNLFLVELGKAGSHQKT